jgi:methylated-DNA-[protein]-cysteine S-methyltransferase
MNIDKPCYYLVPTAFGTMGIVWWNAASRPRVRQTFLSRGRIPAGEAILRAYPGARRLSCPAISRLGRRLRRFLEGRAVVFDLDLVALEACRPFQRRVLLAEYAIPRGSVSTYGRIAEHLSVAGGGRAVGRALAENPFPILIPCHRAVRADGAIGGYQGGSAMKRALLAMEGVEFTAAGKAALTKVFY